MQRLIEGIGIVDGDDRLQCFAVRSDGETFHHMLLGRMRSAEIVDVIILGRHPDRIDDQRVTAFVMADGFAKWLRHRVGRMLVPEVNAADHVVALPDHPDFFWRLNEPRWLGGIQVLARYAAGPAARLRREWNVELAG